MKVAAIQWGFVSVVLLIAQQLSAQKDSRAERVAVLSSQLRWHDSLGRERYLATRDEVAQRLLKEVDRFVMESFPITVAPSHVKEGLDRLLDHQPSGIINNVAFTASLQ